MNHSRSQGTAALYPPACLTSAWLRSTRSCCCHRGATSLGERDWGGVGAGHGGAARARGESAGSATRKRDCKRCTRLDSWTWLLERVPVLHIHPCIDASIQLGCSCSEPRMHYPTNGIQQRKDPQSTVISGKMPDSTEEPPKRLRSGSEAQLGDPSSSKPERALMTSSI